MTEERSRRRDNILEKDLGDEVVLYTPDGKAIHVLNGTAYAIWKLCDGQHSLEDMEQAIRAQYVVPNRHQADVATDVCSTLEAFAEKGLLHST